MFCRNLLPELLELKRSQLTWLWILLQVGITIAARRYDLNSTAPFQTSDVLNLQPVVKHSVPVCSEAKDLVETGKVQLAEVWTFFGSCNNLCLNIIRKFEWSYMWFGWNYCLLQNKIIECGVTLVLSEMAEKYFKLNYYSMQLFS